MTTTVNMKSSAENRSADLNRLAIHWSAHSRQERKAMRKAFVLLEREDPRTGAFYLEAIDMAAAEQERYEARIDRPPTGRQVAPVVGKCAE